MAAMLAELLVSLGCPPHLAVDAAVVMWFAGPWAGAGAGWLLLRLVDLARAMEPPPVASTDPRRVLGPPAVVTSTSMRPRGRRRPRP